MKLRRVGGYRLKGSGVFLVLERRGFGGFLRGGMERRSVLYIHFSPISPPTSQAIAHSPRSFFITM